MALLAASSTQAAECRQALALGLDVSGSVDAREYRLQLDGIASALEDRQVRNAVLSTPSAPVLLLVYEWSGPGDHRLLVPWTAITSEADLLEVIATLQSVERRVASPGTALGLALQTGAAFLELRAHCWKQTLDISGDGKSNLGPRPRDVRDRLPEGITVNALVIGADAPASGDLRQVQIGELGAYFSAEVIKGENAFVETALGYQDYATAMARKLLRELETMNIAAR